METCKKLGLTYLKDAPVELIATSGGGSSQTKREPVKLPKFQGDERTAFLKFPVWETQWKTQIEDYEEKFRAGLLIEHLDTKAQEQLIGVEIHYVESMLRLRKYYGDPQKVVNACLGEVRAFPGIEAFDYKALVDYKNCIINNNSRLTAAKLKHEMSNMAAMITIVKKMPIHEVVSWEKHLALENLEKQAKPFSSFIFFKLLTPIFIPDQKKQYKSIIFICF